MDPSDENRIRTNVPSSIHPISEVGFESILSTSAGHPAAPTTDETAHSQATNADLSSTKTGSVPAEFVMQMMQMMERMSERLMTQSQDKVRINDIFLPSFDPDANVGVREWCQHITTAMETYKLNDYDVRMKVSSLLKGRAKVWVDDWIVTTSSWPELQEKLITTFEPENRYSRDILRFREHAYDSSKDITDFLSHAWVLWRRVTKDKLGNDDAVEAVIGCVDDERLRIQLLNARASSVPELISVASSIRGKPTLSTSHNDFVLEPLHGNES